MTTEIMTYEQQKQARLARKQEREWKQTMANARVYDARAHSGQYATLSVRGERALQKMVLHASEMMASGKKGLERFAATLADDLAKNNPCHAMEWSSSEFASAAMVNVAAGVLSFCQDYDQNDEREYTAPTAAMMMLWIVRELRQQVMRFARYPARSTSQQSNLIEQEKGKTAAELLERAESLFSFYRLEEYVEVRSHY